MIKRTDSAYDLACRERRFLAWWGIYHLGLLVILMVGLIFGVRYMTMPDRVVLLGKDSNLYLGHSAPVDEERVIRDIAMRAAFALLQRRYDYHNERQLAMVFDKRGIAKARQHIDSLTETFLERQIRQELQLSSFEYVPDNGYIVLLKGTLDRTGSYFGMPYRQQRDFALMLRLVRAENLTELPFRVNGLQYWEEESDHAG